MSDSSAIEFTIKKVRSRHVDRAQRYALSPLTGSANKDPGDQEAAITNATLDLIEEWRARVYVLRTEGWKRPTTGKNLIYTLNCPPIGVLTNRQKLRPCNQYAVCPFCWSRHYVEETFDALEYAYFSRDAKRPLKLDLVEVTTTELLPTNDWGLQDLLQSIQDHRIDFLHEFLPNEGAFQLYTIEPSDPRDRSTSPHWIFQQRVLAMIDPFQESPPDRGEYVGQRRVVRRHHGVTRKTLGMAVGRTCLYPTQMMRGPKAAVVELLELKRTWGGKSSKGFRMSGFYGLLRNKSKRQREA